MSDPLVSGIGVCPGVVRGEAKDSTFRQDIEEATARQNLVIPHSSPLYAVALMSASGVICENGGGFPISVRLLWRWVFLVLRRQLGQWRSFWMDKLYF